MIRRISFYGCDSYQKRVELQDFLEKAGAIIQDYRFLHKEPRIIIWYSLRNTTESFKRKILDSTYSDSVIFVTPI